MGPKRKVVDGDKRVRKPLVRVWVSEAVRKTLNVLAAKQGTSVNTVLTTLLKNKA